MKMTEEQYQEHTEANDGYCTKCDKVTSSDVEPDAEGYHCEECQNETVMGVENALILEHIEIVGEEDLDDEEEDNEDGGRFL